MKSVLFDDGICVCGDFMDEDVRLLVHNHCGSFPLQICDPPYGNILPNNWDRTSSSDIDFCKWMIAWTRHLETMSLPGAAAYIFGGIGRPQDGKEKPFRPFFRYLVEVEIETGYRLSSLITWKKKRAYGIQWNFLFCREEIAYLVNGDVKKPRKFTVPLLEEKRGYQGYNLKYPAKSEYLRRTNVWTDITELFRGKIHDAQKPDRIYEVPIEIHTEKGEWVLDPFAGSFTLARACRKLGRRFAVIEKDENTFEEMVERLR